MIYFIVAKLLGKQRSTNFYVGEFGFVDPKGAGLLVCTLPHLAKREEERVFLRPVGWLGESLGGAKWIINEWKEFAWLGLLQDVTEIAKPPHLPLSYEPGSTLALLVVMSQEDIHGGGELAGHNSVGVKERR